MLRQYRHPVAAAAGRAAGRPARRRGRGPARAAAQRELRGGGGAARPSAGGRWSRCCRRRASSDERGPRSSSPRDCRRRRPPDGFEAAHEEADMTPALGAARRPGRRRARRRGHERRSRWRDRSRCGVRRHEKSSDSEYANSSSRFRDMRRWSRFRAHSRERAPADGRVRDMKVGVPKEVKNHEYRVAITPVGVHELTAHGHEVFVQQAAGVGLVDHRRGVRRRRRQDPRRRRRGLGHRRHGAQGQGADRRGVPPAARRPDPLHLPAPGRRHAAAPRSCSSQDVTGIAYETVQLPVGGAAAALPDVRGRRLPRAAGAAPTR